MTRLERPGREKGREKMMLWSREEELDRGREDTAQTCISLISEAQTNIFCENISYIGACLSSGNEKKDWGNFGWKDCSKALLRLRKDKINWCS